MLYFISSNPNKIDRAKFFLNPLGLNFQPKEIEIEEIQSYSIEKIAIDKARKAYATIKNPLFVNDHGWGITALNGFPGAYMKYMNQWLTPSDLLSLMYNKKNREMTFTENICYIDENITRTFTEQIKGHILHKQAGSGESWMQVASFSKNDESIAQTLEKTPSAIDTSKVYTKFANWYKKEVLNS